MFHDSSTVNCLIFSGLGANFTQNLVNLVKPAKKLNLKICLFYSSSFFVFFFSLYFFRMKKQHSGLIEAGVVFASLLHLFRVQKRKMYIFCFVTVFTLNAKHQSFKLCFFFRFRRFFSKSARRRFNRFLIVLLNFHT